MDVQTQRNKKKLVARGFLKSIWRFITRGGRLADERNEPRKNESVHFWTKYQCTHEGIVVYTFFFFRPWNRNTPSSINKYFATTRCLPCLFFSHHYPLPLPRDSSGQESGWSIIVLGMWIRVQYSRPSYWLEQMDLLPQNAFRGCHEFHPILRHVVEEIHLPSLPNKPTDREYHAEIKLLLLITRLVTLLFCSIHAMTILFPWAMAYFSAFAMQACDVDFRPRRSLM